MNHIFLDLEFNQFFDFPNEKTSAYNKNCPMEIMQIGAVKTDEDFKIFDSFNTYVKPAIYKRINPFVKKLTGITSEFIQDGLDFPDAFFDFLRFIGNDDYSFYTWGIGDLPILFNNANYHHLDTNCIQNKFVDVQKYATKYLKISNGQRLGLRTCVETFDIFDGEGFHNALNDATYTAKIFILIYTSKSLMFKKNKIDESYSLEPNDTKLSKVLGMSEYDSEALIKHVEHLYGRPLRKKEKNLLELGYKIGQNNLYDIK